LAEKAIAPGPMNSSFHPLRDRVFGQTRDFVRMLFFDVKDCLSEKYLFCIFLELLLLFRANSEIESHSSGDAFICLGCPPICRLLPKLNSAEFSRRNTIRKNRTEECPQLDS